MLQLGPPSCCCMLTPSGSTIFPSSKCGCIEYKVACARTQRQRHPSARVYAVRPWKLCQVAGQPQQQQMLEEHKQQQQRRLSMLRRQPVPPDVPQAQEELDLQSHPVQQQEQQLHNRPDTMRAQDKWLGTRQLNDEIMGCRSLAEAHSIAMYHQRWLLGTGSLKQSMDAVNVSALAAASAKLWVSSQLRAQGSSRDPRPHSHAHPHLQPLPQRAPAVREGKALRALHLHDLLAELLPALCDLAAASCSAFKPRQSASVVWALSKLITWERAAAPAAAAAAAVPAAALAWQKGRQGGGRAHTTARMAREEEQQPVRARAQAEAEEAEGEEVEEEADRGQGEGSRAAASALWASLSPCPGRVPRVLRLMQGLTRRLCCEAVHHKTVSPRDAAQVLYAHARVAMPPRAQEADFLLACVEWNMSSLSPQDCAMLCYALGKLQLQPAPHQLHNFLAATTPLLHRLSPQGLSNMAWGLAALQAQPSPQHWGTTFLSAALKHMTAFSNQELALLVWALPRLGLEPARSWLVRLEGEVAGRLHGLQPQDVSNLLWGIARLRHQPDPFLVLMVAQEVAQRIVGPASAGSTTDAAWLTGHSAEGTQKAFADLQGGTSPPGPPHSPHSGPSIMPAAAAQSSAAAAGTAAVSEAPAAQASPCLQGPPTEHPAPHPSDPLLHLGSGPARAAARSSLSGFLLAGAVPLSSAPSPTPALKPPPPHPHYAAAASSIPLPPASTSHLFQGPMPHPHPSSLGLAPPQATLRGADANACLPEGSMAAGLSATDERAGAVTPHPHSIPFIQAQDYPGSPSQGPMWGDLIQPSSQPSATQPAPFPDSPGSSSGRNFGSRPGSSSSGSESGSKSAPVSGGLDCHAAAARGPVGFGALAQPSQDDTVVGWGPTTRPQVLITLLGSCALFRTLPPSGVLEGLTRNLGARLHTCNAADLASTLAALARLRFLPDERWMLRFFAAARGRMTQFNGPQLVALLHGLAGLRVRPDHAWMEWALAEVGTKLPCCQPTDFARLAWALGMLGYRPSDSWLRAFCDASSPGLGQATAHELWMLCCGLTKLGLHPSPSCTPSTPKGQSPPPPPSQFDPLQDLLPMLPPLSNPHARPDSLQHVPLVVLPAASSQPAALRDSPAAPAAAWGELPPPGSTPRPPPATFPLPPQWVAAMQQAVISRVSNFKPRDLHAVLLALAQLRACAPAPPGPLPPRNCTCVQQRWQQQGQQPYVARHGSVRQHSAAASAPASTPPDSLPARRSTGPVSQGQPTAVPTEGHRSSSSGSSDSRMQPFSSPTVLLLQARRGGASQAGTAPPARVCASTLAANMPCASRRSRAAQQAGGQLGTPDFEGVGGGAGAAAEHAGHGTLQQGLPGVSSMSGDAWDAALLDAYSTASLMLLAPPLLARRRVEAVQQRLCKKSARQCRGQEFRAVLRRRVQGHAQQRQTEEFMEDNATKAAALQRPQGGG